MKVTAQGIINRPPEDVWAFMSDIRNYIHWNPSISNPRLTSEGPFRLGATFAFEMEYNKKMYNVTGTVTAFQPNRHLGLSIRGGPIPLNESLVLEPVPEGTQITHTINFYLDNPVLNALLSLFGPLFMTPAAKRQMKEEFEAMKAYVESH